MNILMKTAALAVSALALAGVAHANVKAEWPSFNRVDSNRDGYIDQQEAQSTRNLELNVKSADSDGDGKVSRSEYSAALHLNNNPEDSLGTGNAPGSAGRDSGNRGNTSGAPESSSTEGSTYR